MSSSLPLTLSGPLDQMSNLSFEREDGTLLRAKAAPNGMVGYVAGQLTLHLLGQLPQLVVILVPSFLLFDGLMADPSGWWTVTWVVLLGILATLPIGIVIGSLVPGVQKVLFKAIVFRLSLALDALLPAQLVIQDMARRERLIMFLK